MSDTPQTDSVMRAAGNLKPAAVVVNVAFVRELERELNNWKQWHEQARLGGQALAAERDKLLASITAHHAQKADDRCIEDDDRLYAAAGLPPCDRRVGSKADMLANCARFIERRCESGGWKSYLELEREIKASAKAVTALANFVSAVEDYDHSGVWPDNGTILRMAQSGRDALDRKLATEVINDETPVTNAATFEVLSTLQSGTIKVVRAELAKRFERGLATAKSELEQFRKREHDRQIIRDSEALDRQDDLEAERRREANLRREIGLEW